MGLMARERDRKRQTTANHPSFKTGVWVSLLPRETEHVGEGERERESQRERV